MPESDGSVYTEINVTCLVIANVKHPITSIDIDRSRNKEENMDFKF